MLVTITGKQNEEVLTTTSRQVAEVFEKEHKNVLQSIDNLIMQLEYAENSAHLFIRTEYTQEQNKQKYPEYLITRDGFSLLIMGFTGDKALQWKLKYIQAFNEMEKELQRIYKERQQWEIERAKGVVIRHILTDTIKMKVAETPNKKFAYPNYTKLIYKALFGMSIDELRDEIGVKGKESIRDYLSAERLKDIESLEMLISSLINCGWGYDQIKQFIQDNAVKQIA